MTSHHGSRQLLAVLCVLLATVGCASRESAPRDAVAVDAAQGQVVAASRVLRAWDAERAAAYAEGSVASLRRLYVDSAGRADVAMLRSYLRRGLRVEEMRMQVLRLEVLDRRPGSWFLRVTDRLSHAVAVGKGARVVLPRDAASTREVRLVRVAGEWRVAGVRPGEVSASGPRR